MNVQAILVLMVELALTGLIIIYVHADQDTLEQNVKQVCGGYKQETPQSRHSHQN